MLKRKGLSKKMTKLILGLAIFGVTTITAFTTVSAYSGYVSLSYNTYSSGNGSVDGSNNGQYYNLSKNKTTLRVTDKSGEGSINVSLRKGWVEYGTVHVSDTGKYSYGTVSKGKYHLFAWGGNAQTTMSLSGYLDQ